MTRLIFESPQKKTWGSVIQKHFSLARLLRRQLLKYMLTTLSNTLYFCWKNVTKDAYV